MAPSSDPRDYLGEVRKRNELRREARLPLLDETGEADRLRQLDVGAAFANFFAHLMLPHNIRWDRPPSSWSESMGRIGPQRRAEDRMRPEVDRQWAAILEAGTWSEWLHRSDARPLSSTVWIPNDITPADVGHQ
jgi:hypothetical protein